MNAENHEPAARLPLEMQVEYRRSYARDCAQGTLKNISLTGAYLSTGESIDLAPNDKLTITFTVGGRRREVVAKVVWHNQIGCGIQFQPFNNRDVQIVDDLMYFVENKRQKGRTVLGEIFKRVS